MLGKNPKDQVIVHVDGKGLKTLFSHGIRRFKDRCETSDPLLNQSCRFLL